MIERNINKKKQYWVIQNHKNQTNILKRVKKKEGNKRKTPVSAVVKIENPEH